MPKALGISAALVALLAAGCMTDEVARDLGSMHAGPLPDLSRSVEGLPRAAPQGEVRLEDGDRYELTASPVAHDPGVGRPIRMWAYNGQVPGPILRVPLGASVTVVLRNELPVPTTVHWHGLRLAPENDGVPGLSQAPVPSGGSFRYSLIFPDEGVFWYHPHVREDVEQDLGLAGVILVEGPRRELFWPREEVLVLDDLLVEDGDIAPYGLEHPSRVLLGRYGDLLLVNGEAAPLRGSAAPGERVRLHLLDAANARPFSLRFDGAAAVERIGADGGFYARPLPLQDKLFIAPAERYTVDVVMPQSGEVLLVNHIPEGDELLARWRVSGDPAGADPGAPGGPHERARASLEDVLARPAGFPGISWELSMRVLNTTWGSEMGIMTNAFRHPIHGDTDEWPAGIAWTDFVAPINALSTTQNVEWVIRDLVTFAENEDARYNLTQGTYVDVLLKNPAVGWNHMQHPFHLHGQRFLVSRIDGRPAPDPVWRDTVMVPTQSEVMITVEASNPGTWLYHCHISEHMEAGMMGTMTVR